MEPLASSQRSKSRSTVGRENAFTRLYEEHHAAVLAYCRRRTDVADAQDATAEVFTIAWHKITEIPQGVGQRAWLYGVAYRVLGHQWRSRDRRHRLHQRIAGQAPSVAPPPEVVVVQRAEDQLVIQAAQRLRRLDREILMLAGWEGLPHGEIADILGISIAAVDQRFHRAKKRLAREYERLKPSTPQRDEKGGKA